MVRVCTIIFYFQFTTDKDGSALGVTVTRGTLLTHCRVLTTTCQYKEGNYTSFSNTCTCIYCVYFTCCTCIGEIVVCTEDPKRSIGLWHGVMAVSGYCLLFTGELATLRN